ncbi:class I SAM-dependent methyltransferase [Streptomyces sp. NPDC016845]|uniref:class I SAM-dependent methyltransferase n=1 Tax=Streptomyces sp. NPDC016845 TaxID=3364972 RepID=UPI0037B50B15
MTEQQERTRAGYDGVVELYASLFGARLEGQPFSRGMVSAFAGLVREAGDVRVADVGCGPGHVTGLLGEMGVEAVGFDLSPGMVEYARRAEPGLRFEVGRMEALPVADGAFGGVLAHYSVIHTPPGEVPALLEELVRVLAPGGLVLVSFFAVEGGGEAVPFAHKVAPAYSWPVERFAALMADAGAEPFARLVHDPRSERGFLDAHLMARRN